MADRPPRRPGGSQRPSRPRRTRRPDDARRDRDEKRPNRGKRPRGAAAQPVPFETIYEDDHLWVVNKPSGVPSQPTQRGEPNLHDTLRQHPKGASLLHRLDQPASGLLVFGRSVDANRALTEALRAHTVQRGYLAVLVGAVAEDHTSWQTPLRGKPARTEVEVLGRASDLCAVRLRLHTGRTHQIRQHAAMASAPLAGDRRYGGHAAQRHPRVALHAATLGFDHPITGAPMIWHAPLPPALYELWRRAGGPEQP